MRRALLLIVCLVSVMALGSTLTGCQDGGSTLPEVSSGQLKIDASASHTIGYGYLSTSFFVNIVGGNPPYMVVWNFGDNSEPIIGDRASHLYEVAGKYVCSVIVNDSADALTGYIGSVATDFVDITVFSSGV